MARLTTTLPYALFTVLILLFLSSLASAKTNGTIINNGTYIIPTHKPTAHSTVVPTTTLAPKTTATETAARAASPQRQSSRLEYHLLTLGPGLRWLVHWLWVCLLDWAWSWDCR